MNSGEIVDKDLELFAAKASAVKGREGHTGVRPGQGGGTWRRTICMQFIIA